MFGDAGLFGEADGFGVCVCVDGKGHDQTSADFVPALFGISRYYRRVESRWVVIISVCGVF